MIILYLFHTIKIPFHMFLMVIRKISNFSYHHQKHVVTSLRWGGELLDGFIYYFARVEQLATGPEHPTLHNSTSFGHIEIFSYVSQRTIKYLALAPTLLPYH